MFRRFFRVRLFMVLPVVLVAMLQSPALAATIDPYLTRYLHVTEPIALQLNEQGETRSFLPEDLSRGKQLFASSCMELSCRWSNFTKSPSFSLPGKAQRSNSSA